MDKRARDSLLENHPSMAVAVTVGCRRPWGASNKGLLWLGDGRDVVSIEARTLFFSLSLDLLEKMGSLFEHSSFGQGIVYAGRSGVNQPNLIGDYGSARRFCLNLASPDLAAKFQDVHPAHSVIFDWGDGHDSGEARERIFDIIRAGVVLHAGIIAEPSKECSDPESREGRSWVACRAELARIAEHLASMQPLGEMTHAMQDRQDFGVPGLNLGDLSAVKSFCEKGRLSKSLLGDSMACPQKTLNPRSRSL